MGVSEPDLTDTYTTRARASIKSGTQQCSKGSCGKFSAFHIKVDAEEGLIVLIG